MGEDGPHLRLSRTFQAALRAAGRGRYYNTNKGARQFGALLRRHPLREVRATLRWYAKNLQGEYVPRAHSAGAFRDKYDRIREAMQRDLGSVRVGPEAAGCARRLLTHQEWPRGSDKYLPQLVQRCLDAYAAWVRGPLALAGRLPGEMAKLCKDETRLPEKPRAVRRAYYRLRRVRQTLELLANRGVLPHGLRFVEDWWAGPVRLYLARSARPVEDLSRLVFRPDHPAFDRMMRGLVYDYYDDSSPWDHLLEALKDAG